MANVLRGLVKYIGPTNPINTKSGQPFNKRELVLDCTRYDQYTGQKGFENTPIISFTQDKCSLLDSLHVGDVVEVSIDINGRYYPEKNTYFNDVRGYKVEVMRKAQQSQGAPQQAVQAQGVQPVQQPYQQNVQQMPYQNVQYPPQQPVQQAQQYPPYNPNGVAYPPEAMAQPGDAPLPF